MEIKHYKICAYDDLDGFLHEFIINFFDRKIRIIPNIFRRWRSEYREYCIMNHQPKENLLTKIYAKLHQTLTA